MCCPLVLTDAHHCCLRTDAILGALSLPDIGQLFPDTDPRWKGATSDQFVLEAVCAAAASSPRTPAAS